MKAKNYRKDAQSILGIPIEVSTVTDNDIIKFESGRLVNRPNGIDGGSP